MPDPREIIKSIIAGPESQGKMYGKDGKPLKNAMGSSALGKYQIIDSTWTKISNQYAKQTGRGLQRDSLQDNEIAMNLLLDNYKSDLKRNGVPVNPTTLYAMHFKGNAKWVKNALQNPNLPASAMFTSNEINQNPTYIQNASKPIGAVLKTLNDKVNGSAKKLNLPQQNFNQKTSSMDPEVLGHLGIGNLKQYSGPKDLWKTWKDFQRSREWFKQNKPEQEKELIKYYADKGYITRDSDGNPDGPFNKLIIDKLENDSQKNRGTPKFLRDQYFSIANSLGNLSQGDISYSNKKDGDKENNYFSKTSKVPINKFSKDQQKAINQMLYNSPNAPKGTSSYNFIPLMKGLESKLNANLPDGQKLDLISNDGKRGQDLALNYNKFLSVTSPNSKEGGQRLFAKKIYIPSKDNTNDSRILKPTENLSSQRNFEYIDPGYDDVNTDNSTSGDNYNYDSWNEPTDQYGLPSPYQAGPYSSKNFDYVDPVIKNDPDFEKFKFFAKQQKIALTKENLETLKKKVKEYDEYEAKNDLNGFLTNIQGVADNLPENFNKGYDPSTQKGEGFPLLETASSLFGILNGNKMADTQLPERNEQVSDLFRNFTSEIKKISEIGLKPEDEAYAKNMLNESYQSNLDMIHRASNGNRNVILGNLSRLDYQKQKGLLDLAVADNRAKTEALYKYGEAVKYISDFEANKDIANNERKYQNAMMTKQAGGQLAAQGWASFMDNIQYYKENKPGSANAMLKTHYMRKFYDVDPNETDPNNYYHPDQKKKRDASMASYADNVTTINKTLQSLPQEDQKFFQQYFKKGGMDFTDNKNIGMIQFLANNPGAKGNMDLSKIGEANASNNYSVLFDAINSSNPATINSTSIDSAKTNIATENQPNLYKPSMPETDPNLTPISYKPNGIDIEMPKANIPSLTIPTASAPTQNNQSLGSDLFSNIEKQAAQNEQTKKDAFSFLSNQQSNVQQILEEQKLIEENQRQLFKF